MPVGTAGSVKGVTQEELESLGVQILLANTYHLYLRPGHEVIREAGGLHRFIGWRRPILTDSGGYQVMSLKGRVTEEGVTFRSHLDGSPHFLSPERAVEIQLALGSDICMILDECVEYPSSYETTRRAMELTGRWARRAQEYYQTARNSGFGVRSSENPGPRPYLGGEGYPARTPNPESPNPALFGIVQGGIDKALRRESVEQMLEIGFDGYALGGLSVGEPMSETYDVTEYTVELLSADRPRYLMGVGTPADLVECAARGIDLFDCVMPTRNARNGSVFTAEGRLVIKSARYVSDERPLDPFCRCPVCGRYSRAYIRHLFQAGEMLGAILATKHNLYFYLDTMHKIRQAVVSGDFEDLLRRVRTGCSATSHT